MADTLAVAETILAQMGGQRRLTLMTGASSYAGGKFQEGWGVSFKLPGSKAMIITLNGRDLYDLKFIRSGYFRKADWVESKVLGEASDVHVESLRATFTSLTGLHLSLVA